MKLVLAAIAFAALSSNPQPGLAQGAAAGAPAERGAAGERSPAAERGAAAPACADCGMITAVRPTTMRGEPQWMGTISSGSAGSSLPGMSGPVGTGSRPFTGHRPTTPLPGQEAPLGMRERTIYEVVVLMDDQSTRKLHYEHRPALSVGDKVRVSGGQVYLR